MYSSYFDFSFDNFLIFLFHFSYVSHIFFHSFSVPTDASRSRQALSNEYLIVKFGFDPAFLDVRRWRRLRPASFRGALPPSSFLKTLRNSPRLESYLKTLRNSPRLESCLKTLRNLPRPESGPKFESGKGVSA